MKKESKFSRMSGRGSGSLSPRGAASPRGGKSPRGMPGNRNKRKSNLGTPGGKRKGYGEVGFPCKVQVRQDSIDSG